LEAWADQPGFDLWASLAQVDPQGAVQQLSSGLIRCTGEDCLRPQPCRLDLQPLLFTAPQGARLRLSIALAAWPQIAVNAGDGTLPRSNAGPCHRVITVVLQLQAASFSILPMIGAN
jgi:hypothetical protein